MPTTRSVKDSKNHVTR